jgi:2-dehydropantoate 2-reductase
MGFAETLRKRLPHLDLYSGTTTEGAYQLGPREICHAGRGQTRVGQAGTANPAPWFTQWEIAVPDSLWDANIEQALWLKLAINCAINPLTAIHRCPNGELLDNPDLEQQVQQLCLEIEQVSSAAGLGETVRGLHSSVAEVIRGTAANRSSMLQDVLAGRPTEIDYITGYLLELASRHGVPTPHNTAILDKIRSLNA